MGARKDYVINVSLDGDASGLKPLQDSLKQIEDKAESINTLDIGVGVHVDGNFEKVLNNIEGHLSSISKTVEARVNVGGNWDRELKNIRTLSEGIIQEQDLKIQVDTHNAERGFKEIREAVGSTIREIGTLNTMNTIDMSSGIVRGFQSVNNEISKTRDALSTLGSSGGSDVGRKIANDFNDAANQVGNIQKNLNNLKAPQIDMGAYYGSYDQLGHLNMGAVGGSRILSMLGLNGFRSLTWGNASTEQTNMILSKKMDRDDIAKGTGYYLAGKSYEGGTDTITHAVAQRRTVRNPDLIAQLYAFKQATGATNEQLMTNVFGNEEDLEYGSGSGVDIIAAFGENVALQTGSEQLGTSAMFDLAKAFGGQYAAVDQYGISEESLKRAGYDPKKDKDHKDVEGYLAAVGKIIGADAPNELMDTTEGGLTQVRKRFHRAGREIGQLMMGPVDFLSNLFLRFDTKDLNLFGFNIPKGTFTKALIGITGLVSAIGPFQETLNAVHQTFDKVTGAMKTAVTGVGNLTERIVALGNASKASEFRELGAKGILAREEYERLHPTEVMDARLSQIQSKRGVHDYNDFDIDRSDMTWSQKRRTKAGRNLDSLIYDLEGGMDEKTRHEIIMQAQRQSADEKTVNEWKKRAKERGEHFKMDRMGAGQYIEAELLKDWEHGKKNEISELSSWQKLKRGAKGSFKPQTTAFSKAMKTEMDKYSEDSRWNVIKKNTVGRFKGAKSGLKSMTGKGGFINSFKSLGSVLGGVVSALNPVTIAFYALMGVLGIIGGTLMYAYANFESVREKIGLLQEKFGKLMDSIFYLVGDILGFISGSGEGGKSGLETGVGRAINVVNDLIDVLYDVIQAITGRDVEREKKAEPLRKQFDDTWKSIKEEEEKNGGPHTASRDKYQKLVNTSDQLRMYDPSYVNEEKLKEMGLYGEGYTDSKGTTLAERLLTPAADRNPNDDITEQYSYLEKVLPELKEEGVTFTEDDKKKIAESLKDPENLRKFDSAVGDIKAHNKVAHAGKDWDDTEYAKSNSVFDSDNTDDRKPGDSALGRIVDPILTVLDAIKWITMAILAAIAVDKALNILNSIARNGGVRGAIDEYLEKELPDLYPEAKDRWEKHRNHGGSDDIPSGKKKPGTKTKNKHPGGVDPDKKTKIDPNKSMDDVADELHDLAEETKKNTKKHGKSRANRFLDSGIGKRLFPEGSRRKGVFNRIRGINSESIGTGLVSLGRDIEAKGGLTNYVKDLEKVKSLTGWIEKKLPHLTNFFKGEGFKNFVSSIKNGLSSIGKHLHLTGEGGLFGKILAKFGLDKGGGSVISKILSKIGGKIFSRGLVGAIPIIGQIIDALWLAWDLTSMIGDFLHSMGVPEWIIEMIMPLRIIQNHWNDIINAATGFGQWLTNGLRSIGLDALADGLEWLWQKIVEIYNGIQNIPVIGWLIPGDPIETDGGANETGSVAKETSENTTATTESINSTNALNDTLNSSTSPSFSGTNTTNALDPNYGANTQVGYSLNNVNTSMQGNLQNPNTVNNTNNTSPMVINNNMDISGVTDEEDLGRMIMNYINQHLFWDAQRAGRTVDNNQGGF